MCNLHSGDSHQGLFYFGCPDRFDRKTPAHGYEDRGRSHPKLQKRAQQFHDTAFWCIDVCEWSPKLGSYGEKDQRFPRCPWSAICDPESSQKGPRCFRKSWYYGSDASLHRSIHWGLGSRPTFLWPHRWLEWQAHKRRCQHWRSHPWIEWHAIRRQSVGTTSWDGFSYFFHTPHRLEVQPSWWSYVGRPDAREFCLRRSKQFRFVQDFCKEFRLSGSQNFPWQL